MNKSTGYILVILVVFSYVGYYSYNLFLNSPRFTPAPVTNAKFVTVPLLAVDQDEKGMVIPLVVELSPGTGKILVNIDNPSFIQDTQDSMRLAVKEAAQMTNMKLDNYDITFSIQSNVSVLGGPSAGAAMTIATMALLLNKPIASNVAITGTIMEGGYIGQVGGVLAKATAAKDYGASLLLVPPGESVYREPLETCTQKNSKGYSQKECFITYNTVNISKDVGITVEEVGTISDAMVFMLE